MEKKTRLGTPPLQVLLARRYILGEKKVLIATETGYQLLAILADVVRSPTLIVEIYYFSWTAVRIVRNWSVY